MCRYNNIYIYKEKKSTNGRLKKKKTVATVQNLELKKKKGQSSSINQNGTVEALPLFI